MTILEKGSFELDLGFVKLGGELSDLDRQCAWELYTEMSTPGGGDRQGDGRGVHEF